MSTLTYGELAKNFRRVHRDLQVHIDRHGLAEKIVDMFEGHDCREPDLPLCKTPACHGGEFAILYDEERREAGGAIKQRSFYRQGAYIVARKLGFRNENTYRRWAEDNPELWGNADGDCMFCRDCAFGHPEVSLQDICEWYLAVARRIEKLRDPTEEVSSVYIW